MGQQTTLGAFFQKILRDDLLTQAAALAYCASLSAAPLVLLILSLMGLVGLDLHDELIRQAQNFMGANTAAAVISVIEAGQSAGPFRTSGRIVGLLTLFLSASVVVVQLHSTLNIIFGPAAYASQVRAFLVQRGLSLLVVLALILFTLASLLVSTFLHAATEPWIERFGLSINLAVTFVTFAILFTLLYRFIPDRPPSWAAAAKSSGVTALLFVLGKEPLASFIGRSAPTSMYGAAGSLILFLIWVYYTSAIIYLGAELALYFENKTLRKGEQAWSL